MILIHLIDPLKITQIRKLIIVNVLLNLFNLKQSMQD
jgi:hypothetical protein